MKKFLLATVGLIALGMAAPASAADMAVKARPPAPVLAPIYDWTGFYIGANGGWGQSNSCLNFDGFGLTDIVDGCRSRSGGLLGGQIGYRWQASQWVFGLEAQGDWADLSHTRLSPFFDPFSGVGAISTRTKTDGIGLFTGQIGYAWNQALFYVKGGAAVTSIRLAQLGRDRGRLVGNRWIFDRDGASAGLPANLGVQPIVDCGRFVLLRRLQFQFPPRIDL